MGVVRGACLALIALFLPPFPVLVRTGCTVEFLISIILTFLGWVPGVLYAWYIILAYPSGTYRRERRERRKQPTTYTPTSHHRHHGPSHHDHHHGRHSRDYDYDYPPVQPAYAQRPAAAQGMYAAPPASAYGVSPPPAYSYAPSRGHASSRY